MGRLEELRNRLVDVEVLLRFAHEDELSKEAYILRTVYLQLDISHEQALQLTRIANVLENDTLAQMSFLPDLAKEVSTLTKRMDDLESVVDDKLLSAAKHLASDLESLDMEDEDEDPFSMGLDGE